MRTSNRVVLFTGAGMGVPLGLPTTVDFAAEVKPDAERVTQHVVDYLGAATPDLESILSSLDGFAGAAKRAFADYVVDRVLSSNPTFTPARKNVDDLRAQARRESRRIKQLIFKRLKEYDHQVAAELHFNVVKELRSQWPSLTPSIFTTNYDLTFERAGQADSNDWASLGLSSDFDFGFKIQHGVPTYDPSSTDPPGPDRIEFIKIHGSLDWHQDVDGRCTRSGLATTPEEPDVSPILYPGYKEVPLTEPFLSLHARLHRRLMEADVVVVVGFAFRDAYINTIFDNVLRSKGTEFAIWCFNPVAPAALPVGSRLADLANTYKAFHHVRHGISLQPTPLGLASRIGPPEEGTPMTASDDGWRGVQVGHDFYAWDGPLNDLVDRDAVDMPLTLDPKLKKALDDAGAPPSWQNRRNPLNWGDARRVFITDRQTYKRPIISGNENILVVRPRDSREPS